MMRFLPYTCSETECMPFSSSNSDKSTLLEDVSLLEVAIVCPIKVLINFHDYPIGIHDPFFQAHFRENTDKPGSLEALQSTSV